jgi:hypothetical protein
MSGSGHDVLHRRVHRRFPLEDDRKRLRWGDLRDLNAPDFQNGAGGSSTSIVGFVQFLPDARALGQRPETLADVFGNFQQRDYRASGDAQLFRQRNTRDVGSRRRS